MNKGLIKTIIALSLTAGLIVPSFAASATKVGVVNLQAVFAAVPQGKAALDAERTKLQKDNEAALAKLQDKRKVIAEKVADFQRNASILSQADKEKKQAEILQENQALQKKAVDLQQMAVRDEQKVLGKFNTEAGKAVEAVAKAHHLDLVLRQAATLYALNKMDITNAVIAQMKK